MVENYENKTKHPKHLAGFIQNQFSENPRSLRFLCVLLMLFSVYIFACYFPFAMEYYVARPSEGFLEYLLLRYALSNSYAYYEMIIIFFSIVALYALTSRLDISFSVVSICGIILSYASQIKYINRLEMLNISDLKLTEAAGMAANYLSFDINKYTLCLIAFALIFILCSNFIHKVMNTNKAPNKIFRFKFLFQMITVCLSVFIMVFFHNSYMTTEFSKNPEQRFLYFSSKSDRHVLYQFLQNSQVHTNSDEVQSNYLTLTNQLINDTLSSDDENVDSSDSLKPNIIVIMNESWWNLDSIPSGKVTYSIDPMESLWELKDKCSIGNTSVNIYGGGTVSSEAEFLTGLNTKYFSSTSGIYNMLEGRNFPSIVDYFNQLGYQTTAIHPYYGDFYNRNTIYTQMDFDKFIFEDSMDYTECFDKYISDDSLVKQIIHEYENNQQENNFIWAISIASHGLNLEYDSNSTTNYSYPISVTLGNDVIMSEEEYQSFVHHVNGIYKANIAYATLIEYFEQQETPTLIVMFGDHCPNLTSTTLEAIGINLQQDDKWIYSSTDATTLQNTHLTPVVVWNNFSNESFSMDGENINALCDKIIDYSNLPNTRMTLINKHLRTFLKTDTRSNMISPSGEQLSSLSAEQSKSIETLLMIQYDILHGDIICDDLWNPIY